MLDAKHIKIKKLILYAIFSRNTVKFNTRQQSVVPTHINWGPNLLVFTHLHTFFMLFCLLVRLFIHFDALNIKQTCAVFFSLIH